MNRLFIILTLAIAFLVPNLVLAKPLSGWAQNETQIPALGNTNTLQVRGVYKMYFNVKPLGKTNEQDLEKCLNLSRVRASWEALQNGKITAREDHEITDLTTHEFLISGNAGIQTTLQKGKITGYLTNSCHRPVEFGMNISDKLDVSNASIEGLWGASIIVPAARTCGVELVKDNIDFGDTKPGSTIKNRSIQFERFTGNSLIEMTSAHLKNNQLKLGNSNDLILSVPSIYEEDQKTWFTDVSSPTIPLTLKASASLQPGTYTSHLTVKLNCQ
ncbi:hypothetical protein SC206_08635 [Rouxiella sp. T17]|uniref:hypothetical protein n=1 Tax=Rouxiella sp. T17 TaxID=3085684 RepID=UPI002FC88231